MILLIWFPAIHPPLHVRIKPEALKRIINKLNTTIQNCSSTL